MSMCFMILAAIMSRAPKLTEKADKTMSDLDWNILFSNSSIYESQRLSPMLQHSFTGFYIFLAPALKTTDLDKNMLSFHIPPSSWSHNFSRYLNDISLNSGYLS